MPHTDFEPICSPDANPGCIWISFPDCASLHPGYQLEDYGAGLDATAHQYLDIVRTDAPLLQTALTNLLDNACKFTGKRSAAQIEVGHVRKTDPQTRTQRTVFFVRDNGVGFDMTHAAKLFGAFERLLEAAA